MPAEAGTVAAELAGDEVVAATPRDCRMACCDANSASVTMTAVLLTGMLVAPSVRAVTRRVAGAAASVGSATASAIGSAGADVCERKTRLCTWCLWVFGFVWDFLLGWSGEKSSRCVRPVCLTREWVEGQGDCVSVNKTNFNVSGMRLTSKPYAQRETRMKKARLEDQSVYHGSDGWLKGAGEIWRLANSYSGIDCSHHTPLAKREGTNNGLIIQACIHAHGKGLEL